MKIAIVVAVNDLSSVVLDNYKSVQGENIYSAFVRNGYNANLVYVDSNTTDISLKYDAYLFSGARSPSKFIHQDLINKLKKTKKFTAQFVDKTSERRKYLTTFSFAHSKDCPSDRNRLNHVFVNQVFSYDKLYPEQHLYEKPMVFVDHCWPKIPKVDPKGIFLRDALQFAEGLYNQGWDVLRWTDKGLVINDLKTRLTDFARVDHDELCSYYRRTSVFVMTHKESLGMSPVEAALCGATTVAHPRLYTHFFKKKINLSAMSDFNPDREIDYEANRTMALKHFNPDYFVKVIVRRIEKYLQFGHTAAYK